VIETGIVVAATIVLVVAFIGVIFWIGYVKGRDAEQYKDTPKTLSEVQWPKPKRDTGVVSDRDVGELENSQTTDWREGRNR